MHSPTSAYTIKPYRGKPTLFIDDEPQPHFMYCDPLDVSTGPHERMHHEFANVGCQNFALTVRGGYGGDWGTSPFWGSDDLYPDYTDPDEVAGLHISRQAKVILEARPDARFWVRTHTCAPKGWRDTHPDDLLLDSWGRRLDEPSYASDDYIRQLGLFMQNLISFCERQTWANRVIGYLLYPIGEGITPLACEGLLFDQSPVMLKAYRRFLADKYENDAALREAWGQPDISLDTVELPNDRDYLAAGQTDYRSPNFKAHAAERVPHRLRWEDPIEQAAARDYCHCMRGLLDRFVRALAIPVKQMVPHRLVGVDAFKQTLLGWPLVSRWTGDYLGHRGLMHPVTGSFGIADMLDIPEVDAVATPHDYLNRAMGFGYDSEGIGDSVVQRGKLMFVEEDQRTDVLKDPAPFNALRGEKEYHAGLWRNQGAAISRGWNTYLCEMSGLGSWFDDPALLEVIRQRRKVHEAATFWDRQEVPSVVLVLDDWSILAEELTAEYEYLAVIRQRLVGLSRCGLPYRIHLLDDLARDDFPDCHRLFIFPNLFEVDERKLEILRKTVFRDGKVAVFGPASGISDGRRLSAESATRLTGIPLELRRWESPRFVSIDRFDHPVTANLPHLDYGDSLVYGPCLAPVEDPHVSRLGGIQWPKGLDGAGLVARRFGDGNADNSYTSVFSCALPLPAMLIRELARYSGTHIYGEDDDLIFADSSSLTIHSIRPGTRDIALPQPSTVWDVVTGEKIGDDLTSVRISVEPPQTAMFYLGETPPFAHLDSATSP